MWDSVKAGAGVLLALSAVACQNDAEINSSNRGESSQTVGTTVQDVYLVPTFLPESCAIQYGDAAKIRFTATNHREIEQEQLRSVTIDSAATVRMMPAGPWDIPAKSSVTTGYPTAPGGADNPPREVVVDGLEESVRPGTSVNATFDFAEHGPLEIRIPVEACPTQHDTMR